MSLASKHQATHLRWAAHSQAQAAQAIRQISGAYADMADSVQGTADRCHRIIRASEAKAIAKAHGSAQFARQCAEAMSLSTVEEMEAARARLLAIRRNRSA